MLEQKIKLDIKEIMKQLDLDEKVWQRLIASSPKATIGRHHCPLIDSTKINRSITMSRQITI